MTENSPNSATTPPTVLRKRSHTGRIILAAVMLVVIGTVCFVCFTEKGINFLAGFVGNDSYFAGGNTEKEKTAAETIEALGFIVIKEQPDQRVTSIQRKENKVDPKVFEVLPDLYRIGTVNLTDTDVTDAQLKSVANLQQLTSLLLGGTAVTDEGLAQLRNLGVLESLHLQNTKITDAGLAHLAVLPELKILDISGTKITDAGMKEIAKCKKLNWLLINNTPVTDEGLKSLEKHPNLSRLTPGNTRATPAGIQKLIKTFEKKLTVDPLQGPSPSSLPPGAQPTSGLKNLTDGK